MKKTSVTIFEVFGIWANFGFLMMSGRKFPTISSPTCVDILPQGEFFSSFGEITGIFKITIKTITEAGSVW
jgi:hypothetical protein